MRIDRTKFLLAVAAIAAACGPQTPAQTITVSIPAEPSATSPTAVATSEPAVPKPVAPTAEGVQRPVAPTPPAPADEGYEAPTTEGTASAKDPDFMCRAKKTVARPAAASCSDDRGTPGDCNKAGCAGDFVCTQCEAYKTFFKPRVAERAVACVVGQNRRQMRDGCRTYECGDEALKSACIDASANAACTAIAKSCKTTLDDCRGMLSGMNPSGRAKIAACAAKGCPNGLWSCIEGI